MIEEVKVYPEPISIVVPVFNEEESLRPFYQELNRSLASVREWELVTVDDGSGDSSREILSSLAASDARVRVLKLGTHAGKSAALQVGIQNASHSQIVMLDCDLQYDPADIAALLSALKSKVGLVIGARCQREDSFGRRLQSRIYNAILNVLFGLSLSDSNSGLKVCRREIFADRELRKGDHRMVPILAKRAGFEVLELPVRHRARMFGHSKYGVLRSAEFAISALRGFWESKRSAKSQKPEAPLSEGS